ncbi:hypothetical protein HK098_003226 [Nowakowskiella sp. JEL0407]|nr:hypothetical protein HK098_003226 [Nowakowskiella sp. JEL0407]
MTNEENDMDIEEQDVNLEMHSPRVTEPQEETNSSEADGHNSNAHVERKRGRPRPERVLQPENYGAGGTGSSDSNYYIPSGVYDPAFYPDLAKAKTHSNQANGPRHFRPQTFNNSYARLHGYQAPVQQPFQTPFNHGQPMYYAPPPPPHVIFRPVPNQVIIQPQPPKHIEDPKKFVKDSPTLLGTMIASHRWSMDPARVLTELQNISFSKCVKPNRRNRDERLERRRLRKRISSLIPKDCMHLVVDMYMPPLDSKRFCNNAKFFKWFLDQSDFDINAKNREGKTLLHKAAKLNYFEFVKFLLDQKADMYVKDFKNQISFKFAVHFDAWTSVNVFIEHDKKVMDQYKFSSKLQIAPWDRFKTHPLEAKGYVLMLERFLHEPSVRAVLPKMMIVLACKHKKEDCMADPIYKKLTVMLLSVKADALISPLSKRLAWINEWLLVRQRKMGFSVFKVLISRDDNVFSKFSAEIIAMIQA